MRVTKRCCFLSRVTTMTRRVSVTCNWLLTAAPRSVSPPTVSVSPFVRRRVESLMVSGILYATGVATALVGVPVMIACVAWGGVLLRGAWMPAVVSVEISAGVLAPTGDCAGAGA